jgi:hypothetical protein
MCGCSERVDYEGKDFKEWLEGWILLYHLSTFFRCWAWRPEIGRALGSLYSVLRSLPLRRIVTDMQTGRRDGRRRICKEAATTG